MICLRKILLIFFMSIFIISCDYSDNSSNVIVKIYGYAEYDCTEKKYRLTKETPLIPFLKFTNGIRKNNSMKLII